MKRLSLHSGQVAHQAGAYPGFCSMKQLRVFLLPHPPGWAARSITGLPPSIKFAGTHLYTWVKKGTVRVKCPAQEHNTMSPARARTRTARSGVERTNHEATAPPTTDSGKIEVIVLEDQKSRELRRIRTTGLAVYLDDCTIL